MDNRERVIYKIICDKNDKFYIGVSINYIQRWKQHKRKSPTKMRKDVEKYGWDNFTFSILQRGIIGEETGYNAEIKLIKKLKPEYNSTEGGESGPSLPGERSPHCIYPDYIIKEARDRALNGENRKTICNDLGFSKSYLGQILTGEFREEAGGNIEKKKTKNCENYGNSIYKDDIVIDIRNRIKNGESRKNVANYYECSLSYIDQIVWGDIRKDIGGPLQKPKKRMTNEEAKELRVLYKRGKSKEFLVEKYGKCKQTIENCIHGISFKNAGGPILDYLN